MSRIGWERLCVYFVQLANGVQEKERRCEKGNILTYQILKEDRNGRREKFCNRPRRMLQKEKKATTENGC